MKKSNVKKLFSVFITVFSFSLLSYSQVPTTQDCLGAIPVCQDVYVEFVTASGTGNYPNEIQTSGDCPGNCMNGEKNSRWYIFTVQEGGNLRFTITPSTESDDYDWAVYNLTNLPCSKIKTSPKSLQVLCNAAGGAAYQGATGANTLNGGNNHCENGGNTNDWCADLPVETGDTYVLCVSDWTQTPGGYTLDFSASDAVIYDDEPPLMKEVGIQGDLQCGSNQIYVKFSERVRCTTVNPSDFVFTGPGGPYTVTDVYGEVCMEGGTFDNLYVITVDPPLFTNGDYELTIKDNSYITDACGNDALVAIFTLNLNFNSPEVILPDDYMIAYGTETTIDAEIQQGTGSFSYSWTPIDKLVDPNIEDPQTIVLTTTTLFELSVSDLENLCRGSEEVLVSVTGGPMALEVSFDKDEICLGEGVTLTPFTSGGTGDYSYSWTSNPAGFVSDLAEITVYPTEDIIYILSVYDGISTLTSEIPIAVYPLPIAGAGVDVQIGIGETVQLQGSVQEGLAPYEYFWDPAPLLDNPNIINPTTKQLIFSNNFTFHVEDSHGCVSDEDVVAVIVEGDALNVFCQAEPPNVCKGESSMLTAHGSGGAGPSYYSYKWTIENSNWTSDQAQISVSPLETTIYHLEITDNLTEETADTDISVGIGHAPLVNLVAGGLAGKNDTIFVCIQDSIVLDAGHDENPIETSYIWSNGCNKRYMTAATTGLFLDEKVYTVDVIDQVSSCQGTDTLTIVFIMDICTQSLSEIKKPEGFLELYPNPSSGKVNVKFMESFNHLELQVMTLSGQLVHERKYENFHPAFYVEEWDLNSWNPGVYLLKCFHKDGVIAKKLIIKQ